MEGLRRAIVYANGLLYLSVEILFWDMSAAGFDLKAFTMVTILLRRARIASYMEFQNREATLRQNLFRQRPNAPFSISSFSLQAPVRPRAEAGCGKHLKL